MVKKNTPFYNPSVSSNTSSDSPTEQANKEINKQNKKNNYIIDLTQGKLLKKEKFKNYQEKNLNSYYSSMVKKEKRNRAKFTVLNQKGLGRTLNVPKVLPPGRVPGPSYNGAHTIGEPCIGGHCAVPVEPTVGHMINQNLRSANPPKGALTVYPWSYRLGNSSDNVPGLVKYTNDNNLNKGPFNMLVQQNGGASPYDYIVNPNTKRRVKSNGRLGKKILKQYTKSQFKENNFSDE